MAKWLCTERCQFAGRLWDPQSALEKDRVYEGGKTPPEACFRVLGVTEKAPEVAAAQPARPVAISELTKKIAGDAQVEAHNAEGMSPVVDGQKVPVAPEAPPVAPDAAPVEPVAPAVAGSNPAEDAQVDPAPPAAPAQPEGFLNS